MSLAQYQPDVHNVSAAYLSADDLKVAASILYNAYFDDPLFVDIFKADKEGYEARLRSAIREEINTYWDAEQPLIGLFEDGRLLAVTCLTKPDTAFGAGKFWHWRLKMMLTAGYFGTKQMIMKEEKVREKIPAENYHMLSLIGVHPDHQDIGLGHVLMSAILGLLLEDESSEGVGVLVTLPKCNSFFRDGDFELIEEITVGNITGSVMFRPRD
ncbi:GNAT family N-acetyltransferase [Glaciecola petra]|uniref:GNAT family N-acetyltransferase n=1 Tax=Glaciecola petra TaxID=3075602 RepID=A0ABU2ZM38_9ALTE|nr:GNAT family N-acetyltransferase [Aestuariibacter sp. P117]MDT0593687.1 GNAT family N-acetyltransferase [Aestuariibacter sp. P117]